MKITMHLTAEGSQSDLASFTSALSSALGGSVEVRTPPAVEAPQYTKGRDVAEQKAPSEPVQQIEQAPAEQVEQAPAEQKAPGAIPSTVDLSAGLDKGGLPWDSRINVASKAIMKNGFFRLIPGIDRDTLVPQVMAELKAIDWSVHVDGEQAAEGQAEQATPQQAEQTAPGDAVTIQDFNNKVVGALSSGTLDRADLMETLKALGCDNLGQVATNAQNDPSLPGRVIAALGL